MSEVNDSWKVELPLAEARVGESVFCVVDPSETHDTVFKDWECPLLWKWVPSRLKVDNAFEGKPALRFHFSRRTPAEVWKTNWTLWYDTGLILREEPPRDMTLKARLTYEEITTGYGSDNNRYARPWTGIMFRMVDLRRYYYFCLEYPDRVCLYRREDDHWTLLGSRSCDLNPFEANELELRIRGQFMEGFLDGRQVISVANYAYTHGKAGLRANTESFVTSFSMEASPQATRHYVQQQKKEAEVLKELQAGYPSPKVSQSFDLPVQGKALDMRMADFLGQGRLQCFVGIEEDPRGITGALFDLQGQLIWETTEPFMPRYHPIQIPGAKGHHLIGFSSDEILLLDGQTGHCLTRRPFSTLPKAPGKMAFLPDQQADLSGKGFRSDLLFTAGPNDPRIWALNHELEDIWFFEAGSGMGHNSHVAVWDINGDGRDEVFAGGSLIDGAGKEIWRQAHLLGSLKKPNAGHVDATQMGFFASDADMPVIHLEGSSAGHTVLDARDGSLLIEHAQGHVQGGFAAKLVTDIPGLQIAASCRHGNYGILAVYTGEGERIARFQPDFLTDCPHYINWTGMGTELILVGKDPLRAGLFDVAGNCVVPLWDALPEGYDKTMPNKYRDMIALPLNPTEDPRDSLVVRIHHKIRVLSPNTPAPKHCYAPKRFGTVSLPGWVDLHA